MADDEQTSETDVQPDEQQTETQDHEQDRDQSEREMPEAVRKILADNRKAMREAERRAKQAENRTREYEDRDKTEQQKLAERTQQAERDRDQHAQNYLRLKVGTSKGLPPELADRLQGSSEQEMTADADRLLSVVNTPATDFDAGVRRTAGTVDMNSMIRQAAGRQ